MTIQVSDTAGKFQPKSTGRVQNAQMATRGSSIQFEGGKQPEKQAAAWSGVFAMTLAVFALVASEFMPVSLLTPVAADLQISEGMAGQAISISGAFAVLTSVFILALAGRADRKALLLWMTGLMFVSAAIIAVAPNYATYMAGRALIGVAIGGFWSMSAAAAIRLVPVRQVPRALAIFNSGNALAMVLAPPLGSYLGAVLGWRAAFFCLVPLALLAFGWQWFSVPPMKAQGPTAGSGNVFSLLRNPLVALGMAAVSLFFMGQFALFTYLRPFLETVTRVGASTLSLIFLAIGVAGFIGTLLISRFLDKGFYATLIAIPLLMALLAVGLIAFGSSMAPVLMLLGAWGLLGTAAPVAWWTWIARTLPENTEAGGALMVAVVQLAIGLGSSIGGLLIDSGGYRSTFAMSAALLLASSLLTFLASRAAKRVADGPEPN